MIELVRISKPIGAVHYSYKIILKYVTVLRVNLVNVSAAAKEASGNN